MGRFVPIVRTFVPVIAGIVGFDFRKFAVHNVIGAIVWVFSMMLAGYYLQQWCKDYWGIDLSKHIEMIALVIIFISLIPVILKFRKSESSELPN
jgi:membrane-associated protein